MNYYVDIHANLLPGLPAVAGDALTSEQSAERLAVFRESNIKSAVAAPCYDPERCSPDEFLRLRDEAVAVLRGTEPPNIVPGAVLHLDYCLAHMRGLKPFVLGDSGYLLLDLQPEPVTPEFCESLTRLRIVSGLCPIAVDTDRFFDVWSPEDWYALRQAGVLLQISIDGLLLPEKRKFSLYLLANQYAHFVATGGRSPAVPLRFTEAMRVLQRSLPAELYRRVKNNAGMLLSNAEPSVFLST